MIKRFSMFFKVSLLLSWLITVDKSKHDNRHHTARIVALIKIIGCEGGKKIYEVIELTASTFSENFTVRPEDNLKEWNVNLTLKKFNISVDSLEKYTVDEIGQFSKVETFIGDKLNRRVYIFEKKALSSLNSVNALLSTHINSAEKKDLSYFKAFHESRKDMRKFYDLLIIENLGVCILIESNKEPSTDTNIVKKNNWTSVPINRDTFLENIAVEFDLQLKILNTHNASTLEKIEVNLREHRPDKIFCAQEEFPMKLDLISIVKKWRHFSIAEDLSKVRIESDLVKGELTGLYREWIEHTGNLLMNEDLAQICTMMWTLWDEFKKLSLIEDNLLRYELFLSDLSKEPEFLRQYYFEGLMKVYDPFKSVYESYRTRLEGEDKRLSMFSELLIPHLKSLVDRGEKMLGNLEMVSVDGIKSAFPGESEIAETYRTLFLKKLSESVKSKAKEDIKIKQFFEGNHEYFKKIIQEYKDNQGKSEFTGNPLQSLDLIFKKLLEPPKHKSIRSVKDGFYIFKLDQGCVLTNYLALCNELTGKSWEMDFNKVASLPKKPRAESLEFVKNPMPELIKEFVILLGLENKFTNKAKRVLGLGRLYSEISNRMNDFFNIIRVWCAISHYTNLTLNDLRKYDSNYKPHFSEDKKQDGERIYESVKVNLEKIVGPLGEEGVLEKFYDKVLIGECFDNHYENSKKLAEISTLVESGAKYILSTLLEVLRKEKDGKRDKKEVELLNHLIVIGELIENILTHSKNYRYLEILSNYYLDMSTVSKLVSDIQGKDVCFEEHASNIREAVKNSRRRR